MYDHLALHCLWNDAGNNEIISTYNDFYEDIFSTSLYYINLKAIQDLRCKESHF
jgi:hypothetical protein